MADASDVGCWFFEVYTRNPETMEGGWNIRVGFVVRARDRADAEGQIQARFGRLFDVVIQLYRASLSPLGCKTYVIR